MLLVFAVIFMWIYEFKLSFFCWQLRRNQATSQVTHTELSRHPEAKFLYEILKAEVGKVTGSSTSSHLKRSLSLLLFLLFSHFNSK